MTNILYLVDAPVPLLISAASVHPEEKTIRLIGLELVWILRLWPAVKAFTDTASSHGKQTQHSLVLNMAFRRILHLASRSYLFCQHSFVAGFKALWLSPAHKLLSLNTNEK